MPYNHQSPHTEAAIAVLRMANHLAGVGLAMLGGSDLSPDDTKLAMSVLTTLGKADMKGPFEKPKVEEPEAEAEIEPKEPRKPGRRTPEQRAKDYRAIGNLAGHFDEEGRDKIDACLNAGWTDYLTAKYLGINFNAVVQRRTTRGMPKGTVHPTEQEVYRLLDDCD